MNNTDINEAKTRKLFIYKALKQAGWGPIDYERAVREGYLVDYDAIAIRSDITIKGVFLEQGEEVGLIDTKTGHPLKDLSREKTPLH